VHERRGFKWNKDDVLWQEHKTLKQKEVEAALLLASSPPLSVRPLNPTCCKQAASAHMYLKKTT